MIVDADAVRDLRCVEGSELMPCGTADLVQGVNIAAVRVLFAPVFGKVSSRAKTDGFRSNICIYILDQV
jgi:hypothetical protein